MPKLSSLSAVTFFAVASATALLPNTAVAGGSSRVEVTVTNITRGQIISPVLIASHTARFEPLFELGSPASQELVAVAEDARLVPLTDALMGDPEVLDVETLFGDKGPIMPGESASVIVDIRGKFRFLSLAAMLVTTNDAFFALRGVRAPRHGTSVHHSPAYDAGSEVNNEKCAFIPGPPCGSSGVRDPEKDGYVHVHAGIHGIGSLDRSLHDWRNPVAEITIKRLR